MNDMHLTLFYYFRDLPDANTIQNLALAATEFERRYHISVDTPETDKGDPNRKKVKLSRSLFTIYFYS